MDKKNNARILNEFNFFIYLLFIFFSYSQNVVGVQS